MRVIDFYEENDVFGFKKNMQRTFKSSVAIDIIFLAFWAGFYLLIFGPKLPRDKQDLTIFTVSPVIILVAIRSSLIWDRIKYWSATFKKKEGDFYLFKNDEKVGKRLCSVTNLKTATRFGYLRCVSVIDEDGEEFILFRNLSMQDASEVSSIISAKIQIPMRVEE